LAERRQKNNTLTSTGITCSCRLCPWIV